MEKLLYTRKETASMLSISVDKLDDLRQSGKIRGVTIGSRVYYTYESMLELLGREVIY